jgi:hypothetical protein
MSRVDARRRGIPRTGSTEMVRQACTIRLWAKRALFQLARVFPAVDRASFHPRFSPSFQGAGLFPRKRAGFGASRISRAEYAPGPWTP